MRSFFMNNFKVHHWDGSAWIEIPHPVFPLGFSSLLDERLDEAYVTFYNAVEDEYKPTDIDKMLSICYNTLNSHPWLASKHEQIYFKYNPRQN